MPKVEKEKGLISFVVPVYNEEMNVIPFYSAVIQVAERLSSDFRFEFVFTDNHSTDRTYDLLQQLAIDDPRIRVFRLSKNFGYQRSIMTGYLKCRGAAAIQLDCDLQDPPEMIERFVAEWRAGADVVYGIRAQRMESWKINLARSVFYRLIDFLSEEPLPLDSGDFRLISRRIIDLLAICDDPNPYLRGTIATLGFRQVGIEYERRARERGKSKFSLSQLLGLAIDGILNHSIVPLRIATYFGMSISFITLVLMLAYAAARVLLHADWPAGFTTLAVLILISISINAMLLGIIGEYLGRIYRHSRKRPFTIVEQCIDRPENCSVGGGC